MMSNDLYGEYFSHIPDEVKKNTEENGSAPLSEKELQTEIRKYTEDIFDGLSFAGYGSYSHFIPEAVNHLSSLRNFVTSYTPYQPEVAQGTLQAVYEYQSYLSSLTGMDVSNASLYDGSTSLVEALRMALRTKKTAKDKKSIILISDAIQNNYKKVVDTYFTQAIKDFLNVEISYVPVNKENGSTEWKGLQNKDEVHSIVFQNPNSYGIAEEISGNLKDLFPNAQILYGTNELHSLTIMPEPDTWGADIVWGDAQSLGIPVSFGGPNLGFISAKNQYLRQMPGRLIGKTSAETFENEHTDAYVITLSTREQHIRREKATSNICSNQSLVALRAGIYMAHRGWEGMKETITSSLCHVKEILERINKERPEILAFPDAKYFHEITIKIPESKNSKDAITKAVEEFNFIPGVAVDSNMIVSYFSDLHNHDDLERYWEWLQNL